jgi:NADH:ubiquinone oxidoreductase subunit F (NADH-binding)/ferredoxin
VTLETSGWHTLPRVAHVGSARLTAGLDRAERLDLIDHLSMHGPLGTLTAPELVSLAEQIKLRGRGGAGFPFARKLTAVIESAHRRRTGVAVVVNATEGEPAAWKDKVLLARAPHLIVDGAVAAALALRAEVIIFGVADDGISQAWLTNAIGERPLPVPVRVVVMPHRFISGESGALVRGINGEQPIPPGRKVRATDFGVAGAPTLLSNAETYAQLALAVRLGPQRYAASGEAQEPGTVLLSISGAVPEPAVVEVPTGYPLGTVLRRCGVTPGPILLGGYHGGFASWTAANSAMVTRADFTAAGGALGAGIVVALGEQTCPLGEASRVMRYLAAQSAGQCGPCKLGLPNLDRTLSAVVAGGATPEAIRAAGLAVQGRGACSHPDGAVRFLLSAMDTFVDDLAAHARRGGCGRPVRGVLPVPGSGPRTGQRLHIDWSRCAGHGLCAEVAPEIVTLDGNGYPDIADAVLPQWLLPSAKRAVQMCPALALRMASP